MLVFSEAVEGIKEFVYNLVYSQNVDVLPDEHEIRLDNCIMIVTGSNTGIGFETASWLAELGAHVILACRSEQRGLEAVAKLEARDLRGSVRFEQLDLSSLRNVIGFVKRLSDDPDIDRIDALVCNAGLINATYRQSDDGFEQTFAVNHLGHHALATRLYPLLTRPVRRRRPESHRNARVVMVSSSMHWHGRFEKQRWRRLLTSLRNDELRERVEDEWRREYSRADSYCETKLMNALFVRGWNSCDSLEGVYANSVHPGIVGTDIIRGRNPFINFAAPIVMRLLWKSPRSGARCSAFAAASPRCADIGNVHLSDCRAINVGEHVTAENADFLWNLSETLVRNVLGDLDTDPPLLFSSWDADPDPDLLHKDSGNECLSVSSYRTFTAIVDQIRATSDRVADVVVGDKNKWALLSAKHSVHSLWTLLCYYLICLLMFYLIFLK